jgi:enoyl-CoA hydratase/carnithine racemase
MSGELMVDLSDGVLTLTLNRPERLNAMHPPLRAALTEQLDRADDDDEVRAVILTGAGRGFCSGADISKGTSGFIADSPREGDPYRDGGGVFALRVFRMRKPIIAAVNGPAAGFGAALTLPMDVRIASTTAKFAFVYARRGIAPEGCSSWFLPKLVGLDRALPWMLSGRTVEADEALAAGLVSEVVPPDELLPRAREIARSFAEGAPLSVSAIRQMLWRLAAEGSPERAHRVESRIVPFLAATPDAEEGVAAFLEKRPPRFAGRPSTDLPGDFPWDAPLY